jgi:hypothetical protein
MPIPEFGRLRPEDCKFQASLGCIVRPCLKKKKREAVDGIHFGPLTSTAATGSHSCCNSLGSWAFLRRLAGPRLEGGEGQPEMPEQKPPRYRVQPCKCLED